MKGKIFFMGGLFIGLVLAHWIKIFGSQYLWIVFYR